MKKSKILLQSDNTYRVIALIVLIYALAITLIPNYKSKYNTYETEFNLKILEYEIDGNKLSLTLSGKEKLKGTYYIKTLEEKEDLISNLEIGTTLYIKGSLEKPKENTVPNAFNYKKYLYQNKIYYLLNISELKIIRKTDNIFYKIKNYAYKRANKIENPAYLYAYVLGNTEKLDKEVLNSYRTNGISHLFALSGLHVSIFTLILMKLLRKFKFTELISYIIAFIVLILFSFITGFSPSLLRASILFFLLGINKIFKLNIKTINILYIVFSIIVLLNPFIIYSVGFILSFTTTFFLIEGSFYLLDKNYIQKSLIVSTLSFIANLGISLYYFGSVNPVGILLNLIFVPLVSFVIFPLSLIVYIFPFISPLLTLSTNIMENLSLTLVNLKIIIYFPNINLIGVIIYYVFLVLFIKTKDKRIIIPLIVTLICFKCYPYLDSDTLVYFIDVGQGDSALIVTPHRKNAIMIDTGGKIEYKKESWEITKNNYKISTDTLIPFMRSIGVNKLDYLILSHGDSDHAGEAKSLIENFRVDNIYINKGKLNNLENNLTNKEIYNFKTIKIDNIIIESLNDLIYTNENDNSLFLLMKIENTTLLFTGDASIVVEKNILSSYTLPKIDILKVGHHGSNTSTSFDLLNEIKPKFSVISVGLNNRYNHPHKEVIDRLKSFGTVYTTAHDKTIKVKINKTFEIIN